MTSNHIDTITRRVAGASSRRVSLLALGAAALSAALPASPAAAGKKARKQKKRCKKKIRRTCNAQISACRAFYQEFCEEFFPPEDVEECLVGNFACCQEFGKCRLDAFLDCLERQIQ